MKKILVLSVTALLLIALSSCQFNLFAAFDRIDIPGAAELNAKASNNPAGFVSDVADYVDNNFLENPDVTTEQVDAIISNLETIYANPPDVITGQKAAVLAGEIIINSDPVTSAVVGNVVGAVTDALASGGSVDPDTLIKTIFPSDIDLDGLTNILDDLSRAATAYAEFSSTLGTAPDMTDGEIGDMVQLAVVSLVIADLRDQGITDAEFLDAIQNGTAIVVDDPLDTDTAPVTEYEEELTALLVLAGLDL